MENKRELLFKLLNGEISRAMLNPKPFLFVVQTTIEGVLVEEQFYATKTCTAPTEADQITAADALEIADAIRKGDLFGLAFISSKNFENTSQVHKWRPFDNNMMVGIDWTGNELKSITSKPLSIGLLDASDITIGNNN